MNTLTILIAAPFAAAGVFTASSATQFRIMRGYWPHQHAKMTAHEGTETNARSAAIADLLTLYREAQSALARACDMLIGAVRNEH